MELVFIQIVEIIVEIVILIENVITMASFLFHIIGILILAMKKRSLEFIKNIRQDEGDKLSVYYKEGLKTMTPERRNKLRILHCKVYILRCSKKRNKEMWNLFYAIKDFCQRISSTDEFGNVTINREGA